MSPVEPLPWGDIPVATVVICTRNRSAFLQRAIASVMSQLTSGAELLIVNNASTDDTAAVAARAMSESSSVRMIHESELGLSAARNAALREAQSKYVIFLDDDAVAEPGWLNAYLEFFSAAPANDIAVVGGPILPDFEGEPSPWLKRNGPWCDLSPITAPLTNGSGPRGCNIAYLRSAAIDAGMFDCRLGRKGDSFGAHEETDLTRRLRQAGFAVWWIPGARVRHRIPAQRNYLHLDLRREFACGRSSAVIRLRKTERSSQLTFVLGRLLITPFHCVVNVLLSMFALVCYDRRTSARALLRTARTVGVAIELIASMIRFNISS